MHIGSMKKANIALEFGPRACEDNAMSEDPHNVIAQGAEGMLAVARRD
jgi:uncharacterized protein YabE (DUF348 family)